MHWCFPKAPYAIWNGSNLADFEELFAAFLMPGGNFHLTVQGDELHVDKWGNVDVLTPGMAVVNAGWPNSYSADDFAAQYGLIP